MHEKYIFKGGNVSDFNFTTEDALCFGKDSETKWFVTYTCNFLNTAKRDENVLHMLDQGGRLIMGFGSKSFIVADEGLDFGQNLLNGCTFADAFFNAGDDNQTCLRRSQKLYVVLYYGPEDGGTLNDTLLSQLESYENTGTRKKTHICNRYGTDAELY